MPVRDDRSEQLPETQPRKAAPRKESSDSSSEDSNSVTMTKIKVYSCGPCQKRKIKCDRQYIEGVPCAQCKMRGITEKCLPGKPIPMKKKALKAPGMQVLSKQEDNQAKPGAQVSAMDRRDRARTRDVFHGEGSLQSIVQQFCVKALSTPETKARGMKVAIGDMPISPERMKMVVDHYRMRCSLSCLMPLDDLMEVIYGLNHDKTAGYVEVEVDDFRLLLVILSLTVLVARPEDPLFYAVENRVQVGRELFRTYESMEITDYTDSAKYVLALSVASLISFCLRGLDEAYHSLSVAVTHAFSSGLHIDSGNVVREHAWLAVSLMDCQFAGILSRPNLISLKCSNIIYSSWKDAFLSEAFEWMREANLTYFGANRDDMRREPLLEAADRLISKCKTNDDIAIAHGCLMISVVCAKIIVSQTFLYDTSFFLKYAKPRVDEMVQLHDMIQFHSLMSEPLMVYNIFQLGILIEVKMIQDKWGGKKGDKDLVDIRDKFFGVLENHRIDYDWCAKFFAVTDALREVEMAKVDTIRGELILPAFGIPLSSSNTDFIDMEVTMRDVLRQFPTVWKPNFEQETAVASVAE